MQELCHHASAHAECSHKLMCLKFFPDCEYLTENFSAQLSVSRQACLQPCYKSLSPAICHAGSPLSAGSGLKLDAHWPRPKRGPPDALSTRRQTSVDRWPQRPPPTLGRTHCPEHTQKVGITPVSYCMCTWYNTPC